MGEGVEAVFAAVGGRRVRSLFAFGGGLFKVERGWRIGGRRGGKEGIIGRTCVRQGKEGGLIVDFLGITGTRMGGQEST